jgi:hypothetical protein
MREAEPAFVYSSTMHGDETSGYFLLLRLIDYLCENYGVSDQVTGLIDGLEIWINPLANPDGTYLGADSMPDFPKRFNSNHVDLNRNFPAVTGSLHPDGNPYQPETLVQMKFLRGINMVSGANLHSGEEVVNYPFDAWELLHADEAWYRHVSSEYARQARQRAAPVLYMNGFDRGITRGWEWYQVLGSRQDWINYYLHARELTLEISLDKHPPGPELLWYWYVNYPSLLGYMEQTLYGIQGVIYDGESGAPLRASVIIPDHDTLNSWIYSDSLTGFFARPIAEGSWDLAVSAPGYRTFRSSSIHLNYEETVVLEIPMTRDENKLPTNTTIFVNPNPFQTATRLSLSDGKPGNYRLRIFDLRGSLLVDESFRILLAGSMTYPIDGSRLPQGVSILRLDTPDGPLVQKIFKLQ